jgi:hypothetical protein
MELAAEVEASLREFAAGGKLAPRFSRGAAAMKQHFSPAANPL